MKKKPKVRKPRIDSARIPPSKANTNWTEPRSKSIRINHPFPLPRYVKEALQKLDEAGHVAYVVGGCVRDFLLQLGRSKSDPHDKAKNHKAPLVAKDYDIATSALTGASPTLSHSYGTRGFLSLPLFFESDGILLRLDSPQKSLLRFSGTDQPLPGFPFTKSRKVRDQKQNERQCVVFIPVFLHCHPVPV